MNNCTTNRQNYTVKDFCSNKTLKIDENCKEKPTLHFCTRTLLKNTQHTLQLHIENFYERNKIADVTAQPTDKNYTAKNYCANKTLKTDENCINTDIAFLCKTLLKNTQHTLQLHIENFYERNKIA